MITEEIYLTLPKHGDSIMTQPYPVAEARNLDPEVEARFASLQDLVRAVRTIRAEFTVPPDRKVDVTVVTDAQQGIRENFEAHRELIAHLAGSQGLLFQQSRPAATGTIAAAGKGFEVFVLIKGAIDAPKEIARLQKDKEKARSEIQRTEAKLANAAFVERAPKEVVDRERDKLTELARLIGKIEEYVRALEK